MKVLFRWASLPFVVILAAMIYTGCSDPEADENVPPKQEQENQEEVNAILESFKFTNSTKITGAVPAVANTSLVKTDSQDTIYTMRELRIPIRISHPASASIQGWYITIKDSEFYYDVLIDDEEDSDTVSVVFLEINPEGEGSLNFPIEITPYDSSGVPVDFISRIVKIEGPSTGCDILVDGDTSNIDPFPEWLWHSTTVFDSKGETKFINAPFREFSSAQQPTGCCAGPPACPQLKNNLYVYDTKITAITSYAIYAEVFNFYKNGTFRRYTLEGIRNFDPANTDWCNKKPAYNSRESEAEYLGTHSYTPGNTSISYVAKRAKCSDPLGICGYGSRPGNLTQTCHLMVITVDKIMLEGTKEVRIYERYSDLDGWGD